MNIQRIGVIPARSGSKRLKGKNSLPFCGMTLVEISVRCALAARVFNKIIITSDDISHKKYEEISDIILFHARPSHLAADETTSVDVLKDICDNYRLEKEDLICMLQPTSPLRMPVDILKTLGDNSVTIFDKTVHTPWARHPIKQLAEKYDVQFPNIDNLERKYFNGAVYWSSVAKLRARELLFDKDTNFVEMPGFRSIDIDYLDEFIEAEKRFIELGILELLI